MSCRLIMMLHPFKVERIEKDIKPQSIETIIEEYNLTDRSSLRIMVNDEPWLEDRWKDIPSEGDLILIKVLPGSSGNSAKDMETAGKATGWAGVALAIAGIVLLLTGVGAGVGIALLAGGLSLGLSGFTIAGYANQLAAMGNLEANQDNVPSIRGAKNQMRPWGSIPFLLGQHLTVPPYGARPYTEIVGEDQYLRILFVLGYDPLEISDLKIGDTAIGEFEDVEYEIVPNVESEITLIPDTVNEESLSILLEYNNPVTRTTDIDVDEISADITFPQGLVEYNSNNEKVNRSVQVDIEYRITGTSDPWNHASGFPKTFTNKETKTLRYGFSGKVPQGQYDVRFTRLTADADPEDKISDKVYLTALRSITNQDPVNDSIKDDLVRIALRIRATDQLNGVVDEFNCICTSKVKDYGGSGSGPAAWSVQATSNPASMFLYALQGIINKRPVEDSRIDWPALEAWHTWCESTGHTCNIEITAALPLDELLRNICSTARASYTIRDGKFSIIQEIVRTTPVQMFTPRNSNGFAGQKSFAECPEALRLKFINAEAGYQNDERTVFDDGKDVGNTTKYQDLTIWGITDPDQIWKDGRYQLAAAKLRPEVFVFSTDIEYLVCTRGDLITIMHDAPLFGISTGRIKSVIIETGYVTGIVVDEELTMVSGSSYGVRIRKNDCSFLVKDIVTDPGDHTTVSFQTPFPEAEAPAAGDLFSFGLSGEESVDAIVLSIEPQEELSARITAIIYEPGVYTADSGEIPEFDSHITLPEDDPTIPPAPEAVEVRSDDTAMIQAVDGSWINQIIFGIYTKHGAFTLSEYVLMYRINGINDTWKTIQFPGNATQIVIPGVELLFTYDIRIKSRTIEKKESEWTEFTHQVLGKLAPPYDVTGVSAVFSNGAIKITWYPTVNKDISHYEVQVGAAWDSGTVISEGMSLSCSLEVQTAGTYHIMVKAVDTSGLKSETEGYFNYEITAPNAVQNLSAGVSANAVLLKWQLPTSGTFPVAEYEIRRGEEYASAEVLGVISGTVFSVTEGTTGSKRYWVRAIDLAGNEGTQAYIDASVASLPESGSTNPLQAEFRFITGLLSAIKIEVSRQSGIVYFDRYEIQVTDDSYALVDQDMVDWYALDHTGSIFGAVGTVSSFNSEVIYHSSIPADDSGSEPVGRTLYYRVRIVVNPGSETAGPWSVTGTGTTSLVGTGEIAYNSIGANQISAGSITADKLSSNISETILLKVSDKAFIGYEGTGNISSPNEGDRLIYIDGDEFAILQYTKEAWSAVKGVKIGGKSNGSFLPFIQANGLLNANAEKSNLEELFPLSKVLYWCFDSDYTDQDGIDRWTGKAGTQIDTGDYYQGSGCLECSNPATSYSNIWITEEYPLDQMPLSCLVSVSYYLKFDNISANISSSLSTHYFDITATEDADNKDDIRLYINTSTEYIRFKFYLCSEISGVTEEDWYTATLKLSISDTNWHYVAFGVLLSEDKIYFILDGEIEYIDISGHTFYDDGNDYSSGAQGFTIMARIHHLSSGITVRIDELTLTSSFEVDPDIFLQHYINDKQWSSPTLNTKDVILRPAEGGRVVLDGEVKANLDASLITTGIIDIARMPLAYLLLLFTNYEAFSTHGTFTTVFAGCYKVIRNTISATLTITKPTGSYVNLTDGIDVGSSFQLTANKTVLLFRYA